MIKVIKGKFIGTTINGKKMEGEFEHKYLFKRPSYQRVMNKIKLHSGLIDVQILEME